MANKKNAASKKKEKEQAQKAFVPDDRMCLKGLNVVWAKEPDRFKVDEMDDDGVRIALAANAEAIEPEDRKGLIDEAEALGIPADQAEAVFDRLMAIKQEERDKAAAAKKAEQQEQEAPNTEIAKEGKTKASGGKKKESKPVESKMTRRDAVIATFRGKPTSVRKAIEDADNMFAASPGGDSKIHQSKTQTQQAMAFLSGVGVIKVEGDSITWL